MKEPVLKCPVCGKEFQARLNHGIRQKTCSKECMYNSLYPNGNLKYFAKKYNTTEEGFMQIIGKEHNEGKQTIKALSEKYGVARITLKRWCDEYGIKTRTISEDNYRRYSGMTKEQIKAQTEKAHEEIRELFKNPEWKEKQIRKVHEAQNFCVSAPERLFEKLMNENGYYPISQYSEGMAGFMIDFAFPEIKLAIEIDGEYWHSLPNAQKRDKRKDYFLGVKKEWEIIRIPAKDFTNHSDHYIWEVIQTIETLKVA